MRGRQVGAGWALPAAARLAVALLRAAQVASLAERPVARLAAVRQAVALRRAAQVALPAERPVARRVEARRLEAFRAPTEASRRSAGAASA
jgi:hypothetical protein